MTLEDFLRQQYDFVIWADETCLDAAATVPVDTLDKDFGFSFGSVRLTLIHMMGAQDTWLQRLQLNNDPVYPPTTTYSTLDQVRGHWDTVHRSWRAYLAEKTEAELNQTISVKRFGKSVHSTTRNVIAHVLDHATHHRGQLNSLIKLAGGTPGNYGRMPWSRTIGETVME